MVATGEHINESDLKKLAQQEKYQLFGLTVPYLIMVSALIIIPIGWLLFMSFIGRDGTLSFENYERMIKSKAYLRIFITTFKISILTTLICALLGYPSRLFHVAVVKPLGQHLHDWGLDTFLDQPACPDLCLVGVVAAQRPAQQHGD